MGHARKVMLSFFMTTGCNLACSYCYTHISMHRGQVIDLDFARAGIDSYLSQGSPPHFRFFGPGEPTTAMPAVKELVEYARRAAGGKSTVNEIQTNGVFSAETGKYLAENFDLIWVSFDGSPRDHDVYRRNLSGRPTSHMIEKNVRRLVDSGHGVTGARATITQANVSQQVRMLEYFGSLGIRHVWADPVFPAIGERSSSADIDVMEFARGFLDAQAVATDLGITYGSILTVNFDEDVYMHCRACIPAPHLTTDGYVSACDMALFGQEDNHMKDFIYGRWNAQQGRIELFPDRQDGLRARRLENMKGCLGCRARLRCGGYCLGEVMNETRSLFGRKMDVCEAIRFLYDRMDLASIHYEYMHP